MSPPGPLRCGSTTCSVNPAAAAASKALPPRSSTAMPAALASQCVDATMPKVPLSSGRVVNALNIRLPRSSYVASRLAAVDGPAGAVYQARRPRTEERHDLCGFFRGAEAAQWQLATNEGGDAFRICLLPAVPGTTLEQDRAWGNAVDRHASGGHLAGERGDEADLGGLGGVVGRREPDSRPYRDEMITTRPQPARRMAG